MRSSKATAGNCVIRWVQMNFWLGATPDISGPLGEVAPINRLFGVSASDPVVVAGAAVALGLAALAVAYLPAWRASHIDPMKALRFE
jgi:ABC-type antimicrobial peptide transport system permease subunit